MKPALIFCHGWACTAAMFRPLLAALPREFPLHVMDLGYFGEPHELTLASETPVVLLGHSFGFAHLLEEAQRRDWRITAASAISGFLRFPAPAGEIRALRRNLVRDGIQTVKDFHLRCGLPPQEQQLYMQLEPARLKVDLDRIAACDARLPDIPVLALHGAGDGIVPAARAGFSEYGLTPVVHNDSPHALGIVEAQWCARTIAAFLATLPEAGA